MFASSVVLYRPSDWKRSLFKKNRSLVVDDELDVGILLKAF
jgi:hypothetical protein